MRIDGPRTPGDQLHRPGSVSRPRTGPSAAPRPLRETLTADEAAYFTELERIGALTYGRRARPGDGGGPAPRLGQRIDRRA